MTITNFKMILKGKTPRLKIFYHGMRGLENTFLLFIYLYIYIFYFFNFSIFYEKFIKNAIEFLSMAFIYI